jgi:hypothetical protein
VSHQKTVCFDFDGVLASYDGWKGGAIGEPIPEGEVLASACRAMGYKIVISTCRTHPQHGPYEGQLQAMEVWLDENKIPYDEIDVDGKPFAHVYIDDRGMFFDQSMGKNMKGYGSYMMALIKERMERTQ